MSELEKLYTVIESTAFKYDAYAVNTLSSFTGMVNRLSEVRSLIDDETNSKDLMVSVLSRRLLALYGADQAQGYLHAYDAAIAAYLYIISRISSAEYARLESKITLSDKMWWTKQMFLTLGKKHDIKTVTDFSPLGFGGFAIGAQNNSHVITVSNTGTEQRITELQRQ